MESTDTIIRIRAYEIWEASGRPDGQAELHWLQAVQEMEPSPSMVTPDAPVKKPRKVAAKVAPEPEPVPAPKAPARKKAAKAKA